MFVATTPVRRQLSSRKLVPALATPLTPQLFLTDLTRSLQLAFAASEPSEAARQISEHTETLRLAGQPYYVGPASPGGRLDRSEHLPHSQKIRPVKTPGPARKRR